MLTEGDLDGDFRRETGRKLLEEKGGGTNLPWRRGCGFLTETRREADFLMGIKMLNRGLDVESRREVGTRGLVNHKALAGQCKLEESQLWLVRA